MPEPLQSDEPRNSRSQGGESPVAEATDTTDGLNEDLALAELKKRDLTAAQIGRITENPGLMKSRKVRLAVAAHPRAPRRVVLRLIRELYTFELMQFSLMPAAPADLKRIAEELLLARLPSVTLGERISLARRSSEMVAGALLVDKESRVWQTALENPRLTEAGVVRAVLKGGAAKAFVAAVSHHAKWSLRPEVRVALLRTAHLPLVRAIELAAGLPQTRLRDILRASKLPEPIQEQLLPSPGRSAR